ncbi:metallophosphoesterase family protein [Pelagicoccus mobilis]|uniref:Serine/threonine protein phosphatase n=1 Tax=Pelagicoccus mobilis TaxID=415221 RepID=A0A934VNC5_9BACT|nr:metallophosphoesterase family protein [Pelagicoccus mobilis]MBK1876082.1 serine/threonine protein phosphatase [Pelagicoccus mobilis]
MNKNGRLWAIGDIHGHLTALEALIDELKFRKQDTVVVLGDMIDRGPDSYGVVEKLISLSKRTKLVCLRGNHEIMLERAATDRSAVPYWLSFGGGETMDSYKAKSLDSIPEWHWDFFDRLLPYWESENEIFVHAGLNPDLELHEQSEEVLAWEFFTEPQPHRSGKRWICGHSPQRDGIPAYLGFATCIDTSITDGGWLTCLDVNTNTYWQSDECGNIRTDSLKRVPGSD